jgi:hypothetical protein
MLQVAQKEVEQEGLSLSELARNADDKQLREWLSLK